MSANMMGAWITGGVLAGVVILGGSTEKSTLRNARWQHYMTTVKANSEALKDQWDKPTKFKGHWRRDTMEAWSGRHGYTDVNGWKANSAAGMLASSMERHK